MTEEEKLLLILAIGLSLISVIFVVSMMADIDQTKESINHVKDLLTIWSRK